MLSSVAISAQIGINTSQPNSSLDVIAKNGISDKDGILIPRTTRENLAKKIAQTYGSNHHGTLVFITDASEPIGKNPSLDQTTQINSSGFYFFNWNTDTSAGLWIPVSPIADLRVVGTDNHITQDAGNYEAGNSGAGRGSSNIAIGKSALNSITTSSNNIAIGENSQKSNSGQSSIISIGYNALSKYNSTPVFVGEVPFAIGTNALSVFNDSGMGNMAIGNEALKAMLTGGQNTAVGFNSISSLTTGSFNTGLGYKTLQAITTESSNVAVGYRVGQQGRLSQNTMLGANIGSNFSNSVTHSNNTFVGYNITQQNPHSVQYSNNTVVGTSALNIVIPTPAPATTITKIEKSTFIGDNSSIDPAIIGALPTPLTTISYAAAIGADSRVTGNHSIVLGRTGTTSTTRDKIGIGTTAPTHVLHIKENVVNTDPVRIENLLTTTDASNNLLSVDANGIVKKMDKSIITNNIYTNDGTIATNRIVSLSGTNNTLTFNRTGVIGATDTPVIATNGSVQTIALRLDSDARLKEKITPINGNVINDLNPVSYVWNKQGREKGGNGLVQYGFIAQEVEKVLPDLVYTDKDGYKSVNYIEVIPFLTQKVKEQDDVIKKLIERVEKLEANKK